MTGHREPGPGRSLQRRARALAAAAVLLAGCSGDGPTSETPAAAVGPQSPEQYCEAFYSRAAPQRERWERLSSTAGDGGDGTLSAVFAALGAPGQLAVVFDGMVPHAPDDIRPETEAVAEALHQLQTDLGGGVTDPLGTAAKNLLNAAGSSASFDAVGAYLDEHCPVGSPIAAKHGATLTPATATVRPSPSAAATAGSDVAPPVGTTLASPSGAGRFEVVTNNRSGFSVVRALVDLRSSADESEVTVHDASGHQVASVGKGSMTGDCSAADVTTPSGRRLILTQQLTYTEAAGIQPESFGVTMTAWDGATGAPVWELEMVPAQDLRLDCDLYNGAQGVLDSFASTADGRWGVYGGGATDGPEVIRSQIIDLESGQPVFAGDLDLGVLGNYLAVKTPDQYQQPVDVLTAPDRRRTASVPADTVREGVWAASSGGTGSTDVPGSVVSPDGETVFFPVDASAPDAAPADYQYQTVAWRLADGQEVWRSGKGVREDVVAVRDSVLITTDGQESMRGLDPSTGRQLWTLPHGQVCGVTSSQLMLHVNEQLAVLDARTGEQLSYEDADGGCPDLRAGGIQVQSGDLDPTVPHGVSVSQALEP